jgi:hypothetical protein
MKKLHTWTAAFLLAVVSVSCVAPTGTPEQQAEQTRANAQLAQGVGVGLLGFGAAAFGAAQLKREYNRRDWVYYNGGYRYRYWHPRYGYWY